MPLRRATGASKSVQDQVQVRLDAVTPPRGWRRLICGGRIGMIFVRERPHQRGSPVGERPSAVYSGPVEAGLDIPPSDGVKRHGSQSPRRA